MQTPTPRTRPAHAIRTIVALALSALVAASISALAPERAHAFETGTWYVLESRHSGLVLDVNGASTEPGAELIQWNRTDAQNQQFRFLDSGGGYYRIQARHSGLVLDVWDWNAGNGATIAQYTDLGGTNQQWQIQESGGYATFVNRFSGKALDVWEWSTTAGARISQSDPTGGANQQFRLVPVDDGGGSQGSITWSLVTDPNPTSDQQQAYDLITSAMNAAVDRYNRLSDLSKTITVYYEPSVPTADGSFNGTIRFGSRASMNERTALHEIAHTIGVGTTGGWAALGCGGTYNGAQATALVRQYDGQGAVISCDGQHFWPYGLNYDSEFSQTNADRHVEIVEAMVRDGL